MAREIFEEDGQTFGIDFVSKCFNRLATPCLRIVAVGGLQSKFGQLISDTWAAPSRVDRPHAADELDQFRVLPGATTPPAGLTSQEQPESGSLPAEKSLRPEDH